MSILLLAWSIAFGACPRGAILLQDSTALFWVDNSNQNFVDLSCKVTTKLFYVGGGSKIYSKYEDAANYSPIKAEFLFSAGVEYKQINIGWQHKCGHGFTQETHIANISGGYDEFFVKISGVSKLF
jgi:hypothetical protein